MNYAVLGRINKLLRRKLVEIFALNPMIEKCITKSTAQGNERLLSRLSQRRLNLS